MRGLNVALLASVLALGLGLGGAIGWHCARPSGRPAGDGGRPAPSPGPAPAPAAQAPSGRGAQPGTDTGTYGPRQHDLYSGHYRLTARKVYRVGRLDDPPGWDHMDNAARNVHPVAGEVRIDVDEKANTGTFEADLELPEGKFRMTCTRFVQFAPCQDGGIAAWIYEHGDSGCGDASWPKTLLYVAGWGHASAWLGGRPLYQDYQAHFMVTQGIRDRKTLQVRYPMLQRKSRAGEVDPAAIQLDFYIRSPEVDNRNNPPRKVFAHFFAMQVTWD